MVRIPRRDFVLVQNHTRRDFTHAFGNIELSNNPLTAFDQDRTGRSPHDRTWQHFHELRAGGFARAVKEHEPLKVELSEKLARPLDLPVRRMAKMKPAAARLSTISVIRVIST